MIANGVEPRDGVVLSASRPSASVSKESFFYFQLTSPQLFQLLEPFLCQRFGRASLLLRSITFSTPPIARVASFGSDLSRAFQISTHVHVLSLPLIPPYPK
jgi:hypothetical protein